MGKTKAYAKENLNTFLKQGKVILCYQISNKQIDDQSNRN